MGEQSGRRFRMEYQRLSQYSGLCMYPGNPKLDYGLAATNIRNAAAINGTWDLPFGGESLAYATIL